MTLRQIQVFCKVVEEGSFSRAARSLLTTQAAISHQVASLEKELGICLAIRKRFGTVVALTEAGKLAYDTFRQVLLDLENLESTLKNRSKLEAAIKLITIPQIGLYLLPELLIDLRRFHKCDLEIRTETDFEVITNLIKRGSCDIAILPASTIKTPANVIFEFTQSLTAVGHPKWNWDGRQYEVAELPLVLLTRRFLIRRVLDEYFLGMRIKPNIVLELDHPEAIKRALRLTPSVSVFHHCVVMEDLLMGTLTLVNLHTSLPGIKYTVFCPKGRSVGPSTTGILRSLQQLLTTSSPTFPVKPG